MNSLYPRLTAAGYGAEIRRRSTGWRVHLLDARGARTGASAAVPRTTHDTVAAINARMRGPRGFRRDSAMYATLSAFVEHAEMMADWMERMEVLLRVRRDCGHVDGVRRLHAYLAADMPLGIPLLAGAD